MNQLSTERDTAVEESEWLIEQNDKLRHLLKQLQTPSSESAPNGWIVTRGEGHSGTIRPLLPRRRHPTPDIELAQASFGS